MIIIDSVLGYSLKAHGIWQGITTVVISSLAIIVSISYILAIGLGLEFKEKDNDLNLRAAVEEDIFFKNIHGEIFVIVIVIAFMYLFFAILQLVGIFQNRPKFLLPAMWCDLFFQLFVIVFTISTGIYITIFRAYLHGFWLLLGVLMSFFEAQALLSWVGLYYLYKKMINSQSIDIQTPD